MKLIDPPDGRPWGLLALCGASLVLNIILIARLGTISASADEVTEPVQDVAAVQAVDAQPTAAPSEDMGQVAAAHVPGAADVATDAVEQAPPAAKVPPGTHVAHMKVAHSMARTFQTGVSEKPDVVSAIYARLFAWDLDLRRDLQAGDEVTLAWQFTDDGLADIEAATFKSLKHGETFEAYQFQASGDKWPSWWATDGKEAARRLKDSPLADYEQITALLKDRPSHRGMDFKAPVGTEVLSPRSGSVTRTNWNTKYNGGCIEVRYSDGVVARFLHLSEVNVKPGQRVSKGDVLALSGNSGRSTAPHLHYEMDKGGSIIDPVKYHGTIQRTLPGVDSAAFQAEVTRMKGLLASAE